MEHINVVIADDNEIVRNKLEETFKKDEQINIVGVAASGSDCLNLIEKFQPDVCVLDVILSGADGFWVLEEANKLNVKTKFIIETALSSETFVSKAMSLGASYYMIKPNKEEILLSRVKEVFAGASTKNSPESELIQPVKAKAVDEKLSNIFITVGIPAHIKGYQFLREAIKLAIDKPDIINSITKELYPSIADHFNTSASKVERAIRHAIEVAWNRGKIENINSVFGIKVYNNNEKPTNGEFIALVADKMLIEG